MRLFWLACSVIFPVLVAGCVSTKYQGPVPEEALTQTQQRLLQSEAVVFQLKRRQRLYDLSWPLLAANTDLCPVTRQSIGVVLADLEAYAKFIGGMSADELAAVGIADDLHILHVNKGSPADLAGFKAGMFIRAVNGEDVSGEKPGVVAKKITASIDEHELVTIRVMDGGAERDINSEATEVCDVAVKLSTSSSINALARDKTIAINAGLMRAADDDLVQYVIAHELAHVALRHPRKGAYNTVVSGAIVYGPVIYAGGALVDRALRLFKVDTPESLGMKWLSAVVPFSREFEAEADYVGLYMLARIGGNIERAAEIFSLFSREGPSSTWIRYTHPLTPERYVATELAIEEIRAKIAAGEDLMPEKRWIYGRAGETIKVIHSDE